MDRAGIRRDLPELRDQFVRFFGPLTIEVSFQAIASRLRYRTYIARCTEVSIRLAFNWPVRAIIGGGGGCPWRIPTLSEFDASCDIDTIAGMRDCLVLFIHLIVTVLRLAMPRGARCVVAESVLVKQQLLILNRGRKRAPNLRPADRIIAGLYIFFMGPPQLLRFLPSF